VHCFSRLRFRDHTLPGLTRPRGRATRCFPIHNSAMLLAASVAASHMRVKRRKNSVVICSDMTAAEEIERVLDVPEIAPCPICGSTDGYGVAAYRADEAAQAFVPRKLEPSRHGALSRKLSMLWHDAPCVLRRCDRCDFLYADPFASGDAEFYELASPDTSYPKRKWEFDRTRQELRERGLVQPRVLEVGAGKGAFLRQLLEDGCSPENLQAIEFSSSGRAAIEKLGINCLAEGLRSVDLGRTFGVVCMFQVLEHLDDYDGIFAALERLVRPGGHVFIATPNGAWISLNESRHLLRDMPPNHLTRWSRTSFASLARRFGWHLEQCELEPPSHLQSVSHVLADRYVRLVGDESFWESRAAELAMRIGSRRIARLIKAGAALTSPACLSAAIGAILTTATPPNIWAHLRPPL
jgi:SAM-dependent methyltransferase